MGGDGGSVPRRSDIVTVKSRGDKTTNEYDKATISWTLCSLSQKPLTDPIVVCEMGMLYNKTAVIEYLMDKDKESHPSHFNFSHIRKLSHVVDVKLTIDPAVKKDQHNNHNNNHIFMCPITGLPANGRYPFVMYRKCKCIISRKAIEELKNQNNNQQNSVCVNCGATITGVEDEDLLPLNPRTEEERDHLRLLMLNRRKKKSKKRTHVPFESKTKKESIINKKYKLNHVMEQVKEKNKNDNKNDSFFYTKEEVNAPRNFTSTMPTKEKWDGQVSWKK